MKNLQQTYFKVLTPNRKSFIVTHEDILVEYLINKWVKPKIKGSRLLVFHDKYSAEEWADKCLDIGIAASRIFIIVECNILHPREMPFMSSSCNICIPTVTRFWTVWNKYKRCSEDTLRNQMNYTFYNSYQNLPSGSISGTAVKCLN